ncbi:MAG: hypothetical protein HYT76_07540 [Deltaproteobacteria bacterium]|nr:hypothetical protein [Deltaproteobacteria bacterium]
MNLSPFSRLVDGRSLGLLTAALGAAFLGCPNEPGTCWDVDDETLDTLSGDQRDQCTAGFFYNSREACQAREDFYDARPGCNVAANLDYAAENISHASLFIPHGIELSVYRRMILSDECYISCFWTLRDGSECQVEIFSSPGSEPWIRRVGDSLENNQCAIDWENR